jgi:hypothetical protein
MKKLLEFYVVRNNNEVIDIIGIDDMYTNIQVFIELDIFNEKGLKLLKESNMVNYIYDNSLILEHEARRITFKFDNITAIIEQKEIEIN